MEIILKSLHTNRYLPENYRFADKKFDCDRKRVKCVTRFCRPVSIYYIDSHTQGHDSLSSGARQRKGLKPWYKGDDVRHLGE